MKKFKVIAPYLIPIIIAFYILPLLATNTGMAIIMMLIIIPSTCFVTSILFGTKHRFNWLYFLLVAILFVPTIFIYYNYTAWVYTIAYSIITLVGNLIGQLLRKPSNKIF